MNARQLKNALLQQAIEGRLVPQNPDDEPAAVLLQRIRAEKVRLIQEGKIKKQKPLPPITDEEKPFPIPASWEWVRLGEVFCLQAGKFISADQIQERGQYPCFGGNGIRGYVSYFNNEGVFALIGRQGALCGNINIASGKFYATEHAVVVYHYNMIDPIWSAHALTSLRLNKYATATAQPGLSVVTLNKILLPLPPLEEQKRIVAKLEELLPEVEEYGRAQEELNALETALPGRLRKSLLQEAVEGRLVPQNPDDEPAAVLLQRIRVEKARLIKEGRIKKQKPLPPITDEEKPFPIPASWEWVRLGEVALNIHYGFTASAAATGNVKLLRITDIQNDIVNWDSVPFCSANDKQMSTFILKENDILIARTGGTIGKSYLISGNIPRAVFASYLIRIIPNAMLVPSYIKYFLGSPIYWEQLNGMSMGTGQPNVNSLALSKLCLPLPPLEEQKRIVAKLEEVLPLCAWGEGATSEPPAGQNEPPVAEGE